MPMGRPNPARRGPLGSEAILLHPWRYYGGPSRGAAASSPRPPRRLRPRAWTEQRTVTVPGEGDTSPSQCPGHSCLRCPSLSSLLLPKSCGPVCSRPMSADIRTCRIECTSVMSGLVVLQRGCRASTLAGVGGARDEDLVGAAGQPGHDLGDPGGVAWGRSFGCRPIWATAVKLGGRPCGELRPVLAWRDDLRENGGALDGVRALPA